MRKIGIFLLPLCVAGYLATPAEAFNGCSLYEHANWVGSEFRMGRNYQTRYVGDAFNDKASSVSVPSGCRLTVWQHANFGGAVRHFSGGDYAYVGDLWNDQISSVRCRCGNSRVNTINTSR